MSSAIELHIDNAPRVDPAGANRPVASTAGLLRPLAPISDILQSQKEIRALMLHALTDGRDYGVIPGTQKRPKRDENGKKVLVKGKEVMEDSKSLFKPGAEKIAGAYGLYPRYVVQEKEVDHKAVFEWRKVKKIWSGPDHARTCREEMTTGESLGVYRYVVSCELVDRASGNVVGMHPAICSSMESKYIDRPRDVENTVYKMACKRALVAVVLNVFGLSDEFSQDLEDDPDTEIEIQKMREQEARAAERKADPTAPKVIATLSEAEAVIYPGTKSEKNPHGGKVLREVPESALRKLRLWLHRDAVANDDTGEYDYTGVSMVDRQTLLAVEMVMEDRAAQKAQQEAEIAADLERATSATAQPPLNAPEAV